MPTPSTRERLIHAMLQLSHSRGFGGTSIDDVLKLAGVKKGALYHHFDSKDDLALASLEHAAADLAEFLESAMAGLTGLAALDAFFAAALTKHRLQAFIGGCPFGNAALEMADSDRRFAEVLRRVFDAWRQRLQEVIAQGQQAGEIRNDIPPDRLARLVVAGVEGGIMMSRLTKDEGPMRECIESLRALLRPAG